MIRCPIQQLLTTLVRCQHVPLSCAAFSSSQGNCANLVGSELNCFHAARNSHIQSSRPSPVPRASSPRMGTTVSIAQRQNDRAPAAC